MFKNLFSSKFLWFWMLLMLFYVCSVVSVVTTGAESAVACFVVLLAIMTWINDLAKGKHSSLKKLILVDTIAILTILQYVGETNRVVPMFQIMIILQCLFWIAILVELIHRLK